MAELETAARLGINAVILVILVNNNHALGQELRSALYDLSPRPILASRIIGLGGRDFTRQDMTEICDEAFQIARSGRVEPSVQWRFRVAKT